MTRNTARFGEFTVEDTPYTLVAAAHAGWLDAMRGTPWPRAYDELSKRQQVAYESGRLILVNIVTAGLDIPIWRGPDDPHGRAAFEAAALKAAAICGPAIPGWHT